MQDSAAMKERGAVRDPEAMRDPGAGAAAAPVGGTRRGPARRSVAMAAAAARGALAGILRRWAPRALPLCGPSARCVGHGPAPASASLWTPRLLGENRPRAGTPSVLSSVTPLLPSLLQQPARTLTYCSLRKGKRKSVKSVVKRFLRLHNGLWVRRKCGYKKKLWKKSAAQKKRLREFVLCTRTQCKLLDKMTTSFWKRRNWYIDDPYQKYHDRTNLRV